MKPLKINKWLLAVPVWLLTISANAQDGSGEIRGIIKNTDLEIVPYATVKILQGNQLISGSQTDDRGRYVCKPLLAGTYDMLVISQEYVTQPVSSIIVSPNEASYVDIKLHPNTLETVTITAKAITYMPPGVDRSMYSMVSVDYKELNVNANYVAGNITSAVTGLTSDVIETGDGDMHFRGARGNASSNYIDGVKTYGQTTVPGMAIENLTVFTGGLPACYGDMTGGLVVINTKSYFSGIREKNMRNAAYNASRAEDKRLKQAQEDEENRQKEIEAEKEMEKEKK